MAAPDDHCDAEQRAHGDGHEQRARALVLAERLEHDAAALLRPAPAANQDLPAGARRARRAARAPPARDRRPRRSRAARPRAVAPASSTSARLRSSRPPIAKNGTGGVLCGVAHELELRPPGGPAWSASRARGRRRCSRRAAASTASISLAAVGGEADQHVRADELAHLAPRACRPGRRARRRRRASRATSGRSLTISSAPSRSHSARAALGERDELLVGQVLLAQLHDVHAAGDRAAQQLRQLRAPCAERRSRQSTGTPGTAVRRRVARAALVRLGRLRASEPQVSQATAAPEHGAGLASAAMEGERSSQTCSSSAAAIIGLAVAWRARSAGCGHAARARAGRARAPRAWRRACSRRSRRSSSATAGRRAARAGAALGGRCGRRSPPSSRRPAGRRWGCMRDRHAAGRARRGRGARAGAPDRVPRLARPARRAPAAERGARARAGAGADAAAGAEAARGSLGRSAPGARRAARRVRVRRGARCASTRRSLGVAPTARAGASRGVTRGAASTSGGGRVVIAAGAWSSEIEGLPERARVPRAPGQGPDPAPARSGRAGAAARGGALRGRLPGAARGRSLRARRRRSRSAAFDAPATAGAVYELLRDAHELVPGVSELEIEELWWASAGHARQRSRDRAGRARGTGVGDGPLPQRHPARAADGRARVGRARTRRPGRAAAARRSRLRSKCATRRASPPMRTERPAGPPVEALAMIVLNGRASRGARAARPGRGARAARPRRATRAGSRWRWTARSCRAPHGSSSPPRAMPASRCSRRCREDDLRWR